MSYRTESDYFECGHCGKPNPEHLNYRHELNCCEDCRKKLGYRVFSKKQNEAITVLLTKASAEEFIRIQGTYPLEQLYIKRVSVGASR